MKTTEIYDQKTDLLLETAKIHWRELQIFFAGGKAIYVHPELDLIDVAHQFSLDNKQRVEHWIDQQQVVPVADEIALRWYETDAEVWTVVVKPWVLVQPLKTDKA